MNQWQSTDSMNYDAGTENYVTSMSLTQGSYEFKVATKDWSSLNLGRGVIRSNRSLPFLSSADGSDNIRIDIPETGTWKFILDVKNAPNMIISVEK